MKSYPPDVAHALRAEGGGVDARPWQGHARTHASFFSGVGGLDLGLERAGWRTVSFSEVDPYASAVLAERWPGVINLGDIQHLAEGPGGRGAGRDDGGPIPVAQGGGRRLEPGLDGPDWHRARLWSGGFPCQDLSVAGKRRGLAGERSGLAFAFLDLVARHRPECVLLENVPGLLSSHRGKDLGTLLGALGELRYGWAFRVLDAQWFGVPQRRRRVFILALDLERHPDERSAGEVLAVGSRCGRDHPAERAAWARAAGAAGRGPVGTSDPAHALTRTMHKRHDEDTDTLVVNTIQPGARGWRLRGDGGDPLVVDGPQIDAHRVRTPPGLAGRSHDQPLVASTLNSGGNDGGFRTEPGEHLVFAKAGRHGENSDRGVESWREGDVSPTLNSFDMGDTRATLAVVGTRQGDDPLLPLGLDSHRYRTIGNGVAEPVAHWVGVRLASFLRDTGMHE